MFWSSFASTQVVSAHLDNVKIFDIIVCIITMKLILSVCVLFVQEAAMDWGEF